MAQAAGECADGMTDHEFYNIYAYTNPKPGTCECLSCKRYQSYKQEQQEFTSRVFANIPKPEHAEGESCSENCHCARCQMKERFHKCRDEGINALCYKIRHNISLDYCDCNDIFSDKEVEDYMDDAVSHDKKLPVEYMEAVMNSYQICVPDFSHEESHECESKKTSAESTESGIEFKHVPLPLPVFVQKSYDTEENRNNFDVYHMNAKAYGLSARSAFKLIQIDEKYDILKGAKRVLDLCAAPGGWSKVLSTRLFFGESDISQYSKLVQKYKDNEALFNRSDVKIIAVDLMDMLPIPGVTKLVGDISKIETANAIMEEFKGELADMVVCDGAPDVSISLPMGDYMHRMVIFAALHITCNVLKWNGTFVMKVFYCSVLLDWMKMVEQLFDSVEVYKPNSSRDSSPECFLICQNYSPPDGFDAKLLTQYNSFDCKYDYSHLTGVNKEIIPILVSDDFTYKENDKNYLPFQEVYERHRKMFENVEDEPRWKTELDELKKRKGDISAKEYHEEFEVILKRISAKAKEDQGLAKEAKETILCELEKRGYKRDLIEVPKFSKGRSKEMQRRNAWARDDAFLCHEDHYGNAEHISTCKNHVPDVIRSINEEKTLRNAECARLRAVGADEEKIIQRRIELYAEHQRRWFRNMDVDSWPRLRDSKKEKKKMKKDQMGGEELLSKTLEEIEL